MYACPKCGYRLPLIWHSYRWVTDMFAARVEDFKREYPKWKDLKWGQIVEDEYYFMRRTGRRNSGAFVQMWPKVLGKDYYKSRFFERFKVPRDFGVRPGQKQLELKKEASS
jgi:hypothetical protein